MSQKSGCYLIAYETLSQEQWNDYMSQITDISLQCPDQFLNRTSIEIIPNDAKRHQLYVHMKAKDIIDAFCVVTLYCNQAEFLWAASHKDRKGEMPKLYRFIENHLYNEEPHVNRIIGMCASDDSHYQEGQEVIDGTKASWGRTHRFHEVMGFSFTYKLEDYWGEGAHAFVFMKLRDKFYNPQKRPDPNKLRYGYTKTPEITLNTKAQPDTQDAHPEVNLEIHEVIRDYLDVFDESFVDNFPAEDNKSNHTKNSSTIKGFTGLAFINPLSNKATMFSETSTDPDKDREIHPKFEYSITDSALTQLLTSNDIKDPCGFLYYPASWDEFSKLSVSWFFNRSYKGHKSTTGYTIFYSKMKGSGDQYTILYFVTPLIENIVWYKPLWRSFSSYSFALILEIYSYLESLRILKPELSNNEYLINLIKCVSIEEYPGEKNNFHHKIATMKQFIEKRLKKHHNAILKSKESAITHYGHTLGHRLSPIQSFFDGEDESMLRAKANAKFLQGMSVVLQATTINKIENIFEHPKKERFLDYEGKHDKINIAQRIRDEWRLLAESNQIVDTGPLQQSRIMVFLHFFGSLKHAYLNFMLFDPKNSKACRPNEAFYSQLFSELLLNIVRYGYIPEDKLDLSKKTGVISVELKSSLLDAKSNLAPSPSPVIVLSNMIFNKKPPKWLSMTQWTLWPSDRENDGPGMAIAMLRRLGLGELWYRYLPEKDVFRVAVWLEGLHFEEV